jgi:hypothetical protein
MYVGLEAEIAIKQLPIYEKSFMRQTVAYNMQKLINKQHSRRELNRIKN